jgi:hypothetical protein
MVWQTRATALPRTEAAEIILQHARRVASGARASTDMPTRLRPSDACVMGSPPFADSLIWRMSLFGKPASTFPGHAQLFVLVAFRTGPVAIRIRSASHRNALERAPSALAAQERCAVKEVDAAHRISPLSFAKTLVVLPPRYRSQEVTIRAPGSTPPARSDSRCRPSRRSRVPGTGSDTRRPGSSPPTPCRRCAGASPPPSPARCRT